MANRNYEIPRIVGEQPIPTKLYKYGRFNNQVALRLTEIEPNNALVIEYPDFEALKLGRRLILNSTARFFGSGRIATRSQGNLLYVWVKEECRTVVKKVRDEEMRRNPYLQKFITEAIHA